MGGGSGTVWKCRLAPHEAGDWQYTASFRSGTGVAVSDDPLAGTPLAPDGDAGVFTVAESDKSGEDFRAPAKGLLRNAGGHYLSFAGSGATWVKAGMNIPENLLAYVGFDNTPNAGHGFASHAQDWSPGDPDWNGGAGRAIVGALNYIATTGGNSVYFLPMNVGGDADDVFPTLSSGDKTHYDISKLSQWEIFFEHADRVGVLLHFVLAEAGSVESYHDNGSLGTERKLYYRELISRFGHHLGIEWNLGEENNYGAAKHLEFAAYIQGLDPYDHPITTHTKFDQLSQYYSPLLGSPLFAMTSFQLSIVDIDEDVDRWRRQSAAAGVPWVISADEPHPIENDPNDETRGYPAGRRGAMWPAFMGGAGGFEWYIKPNGGGDGFDQTIENFREAEQALRWSGYARDFFERLPLETMTFGVGGCSPGCLSFGAAGQAHALYRGSSTSLSTDLSAAPGAQFYYVWFDPKTGQWHTGGVLSGGGTRSLGSPPFAGDVAAAVLRSDLAIELESCVPLVGS